MIIENNNSIEIFDARITIAAIRNDAVTINDILNELNKETMESRRANNKFQLFFLNMNTGISQKRKIKG